MANRNHAGGGFRGGAGAQEENLMRRSNYFDAIEDKSEAIQGKGVASSRYPLPLHGCIVSHDICFFRGSEAKGYPYLSEPLLFGVVACAAISRPLLRNGRLDAQDEEDTLQKIRVILYATWTEGFDGLCLSAFGCGAFRNPPAHIAQLFHRALQEFQGFFHTVAFSIIEDHNSARNQDGNLVPFEREFGKAILLE